MIDVKFILINKFIFLFLILVFFLTIFLLNKVFKKGVSLSGVVGTIKLSVIGLLLLFFEVQLSNIVFYGNLTKKMQEIIAIICFANFINYILIDIIIYYKTKKSIPTFLRDIVRLFVYLVLAMASLKIIFNIEVSSIITTSAVLTAAVAFAMQNTLSNVVSGFSVQIDKNLKKGTWISFLEKGIMGQVENISFRYTLLKTLDNEKILIPNNILLQNIVASYGINDDPDKSAVSLHVGVGYEVPPFEAKNIFKRILLNHPDVLKNPEPVVYSHNFSDNYLDMRMRFFITDFSKRDMIKDEILTQVWYALIRAGYSIPYPHREVIAKKPTPLFKIDSSKIVSLLEKIAIFSLFSKEDLEKLAKLSKYKVFGKGEPVVIQNEEGDSLFLVLSGTLSVVMDGNIVGTVSQNEIFGEMSLLTGEKRAATIIANEEAHLVEIGKADISSFMENTQFVENLATIISARQAENIAIIESIDKELRLNQKKQDFIKKIKKFFGIN